MTRALYIFLAALTFAACDAPSSGSKRSTLDPIPTFSSRPDTPNGACWHQLPGETVTETKEELVETRPAQFDAAGNEIAPAVFGKRQVETETALGNGAWFRKICTPTLSPEFISSLERALAARGYFKGRVTGTLSNRLKTAIQLYQSDAGLDTSVPSHAMGFRFGLLTDEEN